MTKHRVLLFLVVAVLAAPVCAADDPIIGTVPLDHSAYNAVKKLVEAGLLIGYPDGTIRGNEPMARYEFAMAISRLMDKLYNVIDRVAALEERMRRIEAQAGAASPPAGITVAPAAPVATPPAAVVEAAPRRSHCDCCCHR